jgi:hypothetical protein
MDGLFNVVEAFEINHPIYIVTFGEAFGSIRFVLIHATNEVVGQADVKCAANAIGKYVNVEAACSRRQSLEYWVARSSRAMTVSLVPPESASTTA